MKNRVKSSNKNTSKRQCSHGGCDDTIEVRVKFKNPMEVVKYCRRHGNRHHEMNDNAEWLKPASNP